MEVVQFLFFYFLKVIAKLCVCIRIAIAEINSVIGMLEVVLKSQGKISILEVRVELNSVFYAANVGSSSNPSLFFFSEGRLAICEYTITMIEKTPSFLVIKDIELVSSFCFITNFKIEPIVVSFGVDIAPQHKIIFSMGSFTNDIQIPRLDGRVKLQLVGDSEWFRGLSLCNCFMFSKKFNLGNWKK